ncbi:branched-chain amino acid ABC transporter permease [Porphyromonas loveana]|uniref:Branched-chain amino acid transport system permease protein n=1 Tax=Porphyromonas loveana TaxID=1884669 RepID=A0A2U1FLA7_9PORP|nr:branched-chain amino acid ABC transporter permease [Porphyromonas loveana]PVZ12810.1 branched-chain amino acid transport system permease protein [Porphyromonas loveana]
MTPQFLLNISFSTILNFAVAESFILVYRPIYFFHLTHAITIALGAYIAYWLGIGMGVPLWGAVPLSVVVGVLLMLAVNQFVYKPLQKRKIESWQMMIASLGLYVVLQNIVSIVWGDSTLSFRTWEVKQGHEFLGAYITDVQIITIVASAVLLLGSWLFMEKTNIGQQIKAVSSNPELSTIFGISKNKAVAWSFAIGSGLAACAGILIAADTDMTPTMGFNWLLYAVVAMIIGGMGKMRYLLLGCLLLATAQHLAAYYLDSKWMNATAYIILIAFLYFRPYGFSGQGVKKADI